MALIPFKELIPMVFVGIDVSKDSHSCHILSSKGKTLVENLVISNDLEGFRTLEILFR